MAKYKREADCSLPSGEYVRGGEVFELPEGVEPPAGSTRLDKPPAQPTPSQQDQKSKGKPTA